MSEEMKFLKITESYLKELIDYSGRSLCGKLLKRFEIIEDRKTLKDTVRELIYEEMRHFRDLLIAHNKGLDIQIFKFKRPKEKSTTHSKE